MGEGPPRAAGAIPRADASRRAERVGWAVGAPAWTQTASAYRGRNV